MPWLTILIAIPIIGSVALAIAPTRATATQWKTVAFVFSLVTLALSVALVVGFRSDGGFQYDENVVWIRSFGAHYALGLDGLGLTLVLLTTILTPLVILASWNDQDQGSYSSKALFAWMLALEGLAIGVFCATDVFLFYVLFEATIIPIYFLISGWGGPNRSAAAVKFLLYNLLGGLVMLAAVIGLYVESAKTSGGATYLLSELSKMTYSTGTERWLFLGFFIAFAIKAPIFPVHTWMPDATENATPGTSVLMVSVLDKIGTFGMIRFCLGLFPEASQWATPVVIVLAVISIIYGALLAIGTDHLLRLVGYTSLSHFGFIVLGIFVFNSQGLNGSNLYMFNHGLSTAALFLVAGFMIRRRGTASIRAYAGVEKVAPVMAGFFLVAGLSTLSLPGLAPFVSEILVIVGAWVYSPWLGAFAVLGIVLAATYILLMYQRTMTGPTAPETATMKDLGVREVVSVAPLLVLLVVLGFYPRPLLSVLNPSSESTLSHVGKADPRPQVRPVQPGTGEGSGK